MTRAICDGVALLTWQSDTFAYAESCDETAGHYRGVRGGQTVPLGAEDTGLIVRPDAARRQLELEAPPSKTGPPDVPPTPEGEPEPPLPAPRSLPRRFHGTVRLDPARVGRDASRIADEVIAHLVGLVGAEVDVTLEIEARPPNGATDQTVRIVTENSRTLKFTSHEFEIE